MTVGTRFFFKEKVWSIVLLNIFCFVTFHLYHFTWLIRIFRAETQEAVDGEADEAVPVELSTLIVTRVDGGDLPTGHKTRSVEKR